MPFLKNGSETPSESEENLNAFEKLVHDLSAALGPSSGLDSDDVDPKNIELLMEKYVSNSDEWKACALGDGSRSYTRNLIDEGNGKSNLLILVWSPGKGSAIHDHANAHCVMKILKGNLQETLYSWPDQEKIKHGETSAPLVTRQTVYGENDVTYIISNPDPNSFAVSLHLYTPPNAAKEGFCIYDDKTGKANHIKQTHYYSVRGKRLDYRQL
ncbi:hypothetical protein N7490_001371 [Penicillium lividum]|nr:hypothetical protein N7490_001371 [Penicillium lividum]